MSRAVSIHIGVNEPRSSSSHDVRAPLQHSETSAWRMAEVASQAGFDSLLVLRGPAATRQAVHVALASASQTLDRGDFLFVSFSGHGGQTPDLNCDERHGSDESWSLYDGELLDDKLAGYWRLFEPGVRIVVVSESCYSGGMGRTGNLATWTGSGPAAYGSPPDASRRMRGGAPRMRGEPVWSLAATQAVGTCITEPPRDCCEIRASVLLLTASSEQQPAQDGLFTHCLLEVWQDPAFSGSYCDLYRKVSEKVMADGRGQKPQILMLGAPDPDFPLLPAFRVGRGDGGGRPSGYRDGGGYR